MYNASVEVFMKADYNFIAQIYDSLNGGITGIDFLDNSDTQTKWRFMLEAFLSVYPYIKKIDVQQDFNSIPIDLIGVSYDIIDKQTATITIHVAA